MKETEFSMFASKLATYFQGEKSPEEFTRTLFDKIYLNSKGDALLHDMETRTLRGYFYHGRDITNLAKKISGDLDSGYFEKFIDTETDDTINGLCTDFAEECPGIDESNFKQKISERFTQIIRNAAAPKRRKKSKELPAPQNVEATEVAALRPSLKEQFGAVLVAEERSVCPNDGCCAPLFVNVEGELGPNFEVACIDPSAPGDKAENLIALCPSCYSRFMAGRTDTQIQRLKQIKKELVDDYEAKETGASQRIEDGIRRVLEKIPKMPPPADVDLNYDPVELTQKISKDNLMLYLKVKTYVNIYNSAVEEAFLELNAERILRFRPFSTQVKLMYVNFADKGWPQDEIFEKLVDWLQNATNEDRNPCEVIISYFIRRCEVFDAITE